MALCSYVPGIHIFAVVLGSLEIVLFGGVIFGWHSVVYIYKDVGYFSDLCPTSTLDPLGNNITVDFVTPLPTAGVSAANGSNSFDNMYNTNVTAPSEATPRVSKKTNLPVYKSPDSTHGKSIPFDELSCEEQMEVHAERGVSMMCETQDEQFNLIFSLATGINGMMSFPSGYLYDHLGTRISRIISIMSFLIGQLCLIFASPSNPYLLYPGFIGLVYGGYQILLTNLQLSCLIPALRSTIMSLYSGSYDTSASIFLLFKAAYEGGVSVNTSFAIQAILYFLIFTSTTFLLLPKTRIPFPLTPGYRLHCYFCHKFCGDKSTFDHRTSTSNEWKIDPTGSVILSKFASRDSLDASVEGVEIAIDVKPDLNENTTGDKKEEDTSGGDSHSDSASPVKAKTDNLVNDAGTKVNEEAVALSVDSEDTHSGLKKTMEHSPASDEGKASPKNNEPITANENRPDQDLPEGESMLRGMTKEKRKTFLQVVLSPLFLTDLMWMSFQRLRSWIFVGMFNPWITRLACGDKSLVSHYTSVYAALQFFGILTAPLSGRLMDRKIKGAEKYGNPRHERLHASIASFALNSTVSVLLTVCTLIPVLELQYVTFVLHCLHRSFLYGPNSAFVANGFPNEHFGKLFGVSLTVSALFSMIQYPMFLIMQGPLGGDPLAINMFLLVLMLISYTHPIYIWCYLQKKVMKASA